MAQSARTESDRRTLVLALRAEAWYRRHQFDTAAARRLLDEAVRVARRAGLTDELAVVLGTRSAVAQEAGQPAQAARDLDLAAQLRPGGLSADLVFQRAVLHQNSGRLADAARLYQRVADDPDAAPAMVIRVLANLAVLEVQRGNVAAARDRNDRAARLAVDDPVMTAVTAHNGAWITLRGGAFRQSLEAFERAGELFRVAGLPLGEHLIDYAEVLAALRLIPEATTAAEQAVTYFTDERAPLMGAEARLRLAELALLAGEHEVAATAAAGATELFRRHRRTAWAARAAVIGARARLAQGTVRRDDLTAVRRAAGTLRRLGIISWAVEAFHTAGRIAIRLSARGAAGDLRTAYELSAGGSVLVRLLGEVAAATAADLAGDPDAVLRHCRAGLRRLAAHRAALPTSQLRALASGHGAELGRLGLRVLLERGAPAAVLRWLDRTRSATLLLRRGEPYVGIDDPGVQVDLAALHRVQSELDTARRSGRGEAGELLARQRVLERRVQRAAWRQASAERGDPAGLTVPQIRAALGGSTLVSYGRSGGEDFAVVLAGGRSRLVRLAGEGNVGEHVDALLFALRRLARPRSARSVDAARMVVTERLRRLTERLVAPLRIPAGRPLVVVPGTALFRVPWSALYDGPVTVAPSAAVWVQTARGTGPRVPEPWVPEPRVPGQRVLGQRVPGKWVPEPRGVGQGGGGRGAGPACLVAGPRLAGAAAEVAELARVYPGARVLAPPDSSVTAVSAALRAAPLAHLACHGVVRADNPSFSELVLSDGSLTVHELEAGAGTPRQVVLAACNAASDSPYEGEELLGFVSALLSRGTAGLVASVVDVPDAPAVSFTVALHERLRGGGTVADALHHARGLLDLTQPGNLVTWCTFTAYGAG